MAGFFNLGATMKFTLTALAAALVLASAPALAVNTDLGDLSVARGFGDIFPAGAAAFLDTFTFSLGSASPVYGLTGMSGIETLVLVLRDGGGDTIAVDTTPAAFTFDALAAGSYSLNFLGLDAAPMAFYGGLVTTDITKVAPIPEPETYALMLAGLGVVGFLKLRRT